MLDRSLVENFFSMIDRKTRKFISLCKEEKYA
jgi:hypothetical protein